jgi:hypothetical protein
VAFAALTSLQIKVFLSPIGDTFLHSHFFAVIVHLTDKGCSCICTFSHAIHSFILISKYCKLYVSCDIYGRNKIKLLSSLTSISVFVSNRKREGRFSWSHIDRYSFIVVCWGFCYALSMTLTGTHKFIWLFFFLIIANRCRHCVETCCIQRTRRNTLYTLSSLAHQGQWVYKVLEVNKKIQYILNVIMLTLQWRQHTLCVTFKSTSATNKLLLVGPKNFILCLSDSRCDMQ